MGRRSTKENKNIYQLRREALGLTREAAGERMNGLPADRIEKIENERLVPHPFDILEMANGYRCPELCNHYCVNECPIGQKYVPELHIKDLSQIVLEMVNSLNSLDKDKNRLVEIAVDGQISNDEIDDFIHIQKELERISITIGSLQLWVEKMLADGQIDPEEYENRMNGKV